MGHVFFISNILFDYFSLLCFKAHLSRAPTKEAVRQLLVVIIVTLIFKFKSLIALRFSEILNCQTASNYDEACILSPRTHLSQPMLSVWAIATGPQNKDRQPVHFETTGNGSLYSIFGGVSSNLIAMIRHRYHYILIPYCGKNWHCGLNWNSKQTRNKCCSLCGVKMNTEDDETVWIVWHSWHIYDETHDCFSVDVRNGKNWTKIKGNDVNVKTDSNRGWYSCLAPWS